MPDNQDLVRAIGRLEGKTDAVVNRLSTKEARLKSLENHKLKVVAIAAVVGTMMGLGGNMVL